MHLVSPREATTIERTRHTNFNTLYITCSRISYKTQFVRRSKHSRSKKQVC